MATKAPVKHKRKRRSPSKIVHHRRKSLRAGGTAMHMSFKHNLSGLGGGATAGVLYMVMNEMKISPVLKTLFGFGAAALVSSAFKRPFMGAGLAGAVGDRIIAHMEGGHAMNDNGMNDRRHRRKLQSHQYVDPDTLSDTGLQDMAGNSIAMDENGNVFSLSEHGEYQHIGHLNDLQPMQEMQDGSMASAYDLSNHNIENNTLAPLY